MRNIYINLNDTNFYLTTINLPEIFIDFLIHDEYIKIDSDGTVNIKLDYVIENYQYIDKVDLRSLRSNIVQTVEN
jgi:hypothetical protein